MSRAAMRQMPANLPRVLLRSEESSGHLAIIEGPPVRPDSRRPPFHTSDIDDGFYVVEGELIFQLRGELLALQPFPRLSDRPRWRSPMISRRCTRSYCHARDHSPRRTVPSRPLRVLRRDSFAAASGARRWRDARRSVWPVPVRGDERTDCPLGAVGRRRARRRVLRHRPRRGAAQLRAARRARQGLGRDGQPNPDRRAELDHDYGNYGEKPWSGLSLHARAHEIAPMWPDDQGRHQLRFFGQICSPREQPAASHVGGGAQRQDGLLGGIPPFVES